MELSIPVLFYVVSGIVAYLIGSVPFGFLIGKYYHKDIRKEGSGNIGATNVTRVCGKVPGRICFALDALKGFVPVFVVMMMVKHIAQLNECSPAAIVTAGATLCGHIYPIFLKFKGGKGISTAAGAVMAMSPLSFLMAGAVWVAAFYIWRYVSLASILAGAALPFAFLIDGGWEHKTILVFFVAVSLVAILRHRSNIKRLLNGSELKFERKNRSQAGNE